MKITNNDNETLKEIKTINSKEGTNLNYEKNEFSKLLVEIEVLFKFLFKLFFYNTIKYYYRLINY